MSPVFLIAAFGLLAQACPAPEPIPAELGVWIQPASAATESVRTGVTYDVALRPAADVQWARQPERAPAAGGRGAVLALRIDRAGIYRVALADAAWIDLIGPAGPVRSNAHGHGPNCSGIRKIVDFELTPGDYRIQLSGTEAASTRLLVAPR